MDKELLVVVDLQVEVVGLWLCGNAGWVLSDGEGRGASVEDLEESFPLGDPSRATQDKEGRSNTGTAELSETAGEPDGEDLVFLLGSAVSVF